MGYVYASSELRTLQVTGKHVIDAVGRRGLATERLIIETTEGDMPILKFPIIGYTYTANDAYRSVPSNGQIRARVSLWPPAIVSKYAKPYILSIYSDSNIVGAPKAVVAVERAVSGSQMPSHLIPSDY